MWTDGALYENYAGRWSRFIADEFIEWLGVSGAKFDTCIDMGCGTGALSEALLANEACISLTCLDRSRSYLNFAKERIKFSRAEFIEDDVQSTFLVNNSYSLVVSGLVLNFVNSPVQMLSEMSRISRTGGILGLYIWDFIGGMELTTKLWEAAEICGAPDVSKFNTSLLYPICDPENLLLNIVNSGWRDPKVDSIEIEAEFKNFDDYWTPFLSGQGTVSKYILNLSDEMREEVRRTLISLVTNNPNQVFSLKARAWAAKGIAS